MISSLGGAYEDELRRRVHEAVSCFKSARRVCTLGDHYVGMAPEIIGRMLAVRHEIRLENRHLPELTPAHDRNLVLLLLLDLYIKLQIKSVKSPGANVFVRVSQKGELYIPARYVRIHDLEKCLS